MTYWADAVVALAYAPDQESGSRRFFERNKYATDAGLDPSVAVQSVRHRMEAIILLALTIMLSIVVAAAC